MTGTLLGYRLVVSESLTGCKKAAKRGDTLFVSPAMLTHAEGEELVRLLKAIPFVDLGDDPSDFLNKPLPATVPPP